MGSKQKNLVGLSFNYLQVQSLAPSRQFGKTKKRFWNCICKCGNETQVPTHALVSNKIKSCGCLRNETNKINSQTTKEKRMKDTATLNIVISNYKSSASTRNLEFDLTIEELTKLFNSNCHYCGAPPSNVQKNRGREYIYSGIDRVDNSLGYFPQNVVPCCKTCNKAKGTQSYEDFKKWINNLTIFNIERIKHELKSKPNNGTGMQENTQAKSTNNSVSLNEYLEFTNGTAIYPEAGSGSNLELYYLSLGLVSEAGEVAGKVKKLIRDGKYDPAGIVKELGDVFWYAVRLVDAVGYSPDDALTINMAKLSQRKENNTISGSGDER